MERSSAKTARDVVLPDGSRFSEALRASHPRMRALAMRVLHDGAAADDALQFAYLKAFRKLDGFRGDAQFSTWLYPIVYRTCLDEHRRRRPTVPLDDATLTAVADATDGVGDRMNLQRALDSLTPVHRAAVWLVDAEGFTYAEAAGVLDLPAGTVASRVSRARAALRHALTTEDER